MKFKVILAASLLALLGACHFTKGFKVPTPPPCENEFTLSGSQMSASSVWNHFLSHGPANGRLHHQAGGGRTGAWSARYNDVNQWIQVDLRNISKVTRVATQGRPDANQWVKSYTIEYSLFGSKFVSYKVGGIEKVFIGNEHRHIEKSHKLSNPIIARYIRIRPKSWNGHISMRVGLYGCTSGFDPPAPNCGLPLGLQSNAISDSQMSASSEIHTSYRVANGRLHFNETAERIGAWSARYNDLHQWLQVDFLTIAKITKIATQGRQDNDEWVTSYSISYSRDGVFWKYHPDLFSGNSDRGTVVSHDLQKVIYARFLAIHPRTWQGHISLRAEIYGCTYGFQVPSDSVTCENALGMQNKTIPDSRITASSMWDANHSPARARLETTRNHQYRGAWSAKTNDQGQWIQVDFGQVTKVTRIATQGREDYDQWVTSYAVQFSINGGYFENYNKGWSMRGNSDRNSVVGNVFYPAIIARYIRVRPKSWYIHISMRFEVYGCKKGFKVPTPPPCENEFSLSVFQMSASSAWDGYAYHGAAYGRLHHQAGIVGTGAWSARYNDVNQWIQVDLRNLCKVNLVATQGRPDGPQWVKSYTIEYSLFGSKFVSYKVGGIEKVFIGNENRHIEKSHKLSNPIIARYIRIRPKSWNGYISMRVGLYGCTSGFDPPAPNCGLPLGLQSNAISDFQMSASSEMHTIHRVANGRLHFHASSGRKGAWSALYNDLHQWLQVDFLTIAKITKIATQGRQDNDQWVTSYSISYSRDGVFWKYHPDLFSGNSDRGTVVSHDLQQVIYARFLAINPRTWQGHISLRAEIYGCTYGFQVPSDSVTCKNALGMQNKTIPDSRITASSMWDANHSPARARLDTTRNHQYRGAWSAKTNDLGQWIKVDFGQVTKVTRIATQGRAKRDNWVTSYAVQFSINGGYFENYYKGWSMRGNSDRNSVVGNVFYPAIIARYIRIHPKSWFSHISMRFEVYGCKKGFKVPTPPPCENEFSLSESQMSASSEWDHFISHGPANGRLHHQAGGGRTGAWSARYNDVNQWIQVDLRNISKVTRVATQGRPDANQWVKSYTIEYSLFGSKFVSYKVGGIEKVFIGNEDQHIETSHKLSNPIIARYIRIRPKSWNGHISMRVGLYGCTSGFDPPAPNCGLPLGLQSNAISDSQMSASSEMHTIHRVANGRLHFNASAGRKGAWSASYNNVHQWLQVDFLTIAKITKIATQGRQDADQWVTSYSISYSRDGVFWKYHPDLFSGNSDRGTVVSHDLQQVIYARFLAINPRTWQGHISLRAEIYGCTSGFQVPSDSVTCKNALGMQNKTIPDARITASSMWDSYHSPARARLETTRIHQYRGAWSAKTNDLGQWIKVDFGQVTKVTRIATQGREDHDQWVTSYAVQFSINGGYFENYNRGWSMRGNSDRNSVVGNVFYPAIIARYIRIHPKSLYGHISMRFEVYGCKKGFKVPTPPPCENEFSLSESQMSASSEWDHFISHGPANGRLHHQAGGGRTGAWSARYNDVNQWIQVDLRNISKVTRVATQGRPDANQWVKSYTIEYSLFGSKFVSYKVGGIEKVFIGNEDQHIETSHKLSNPIIARYIRIRPKSWNGHISMRVGLYGCTSGFDPPAPNCGLPLGLQSNAISDSQMSASSEMHTIHRVANGRLHFHASSGRKGAWSARYNDLHQWLQVDFLTIAKITKIATQGRQDADQWVTSYSISYSRDGVFWKYHPDVFSGNSDRGTVVSYELQEEIYTRFLAIHPRTWQGHISLRAEIYGCTSGFQVPSDSVTCENALGMQNKTIPDSRITASSMWDSYHSPARARLETTRIHQYRGAWSAKTNDQGQWIKVDFGQVTKVTRIATQGREDHDQWVTSYAVQFSINGGYFENYYKGWRMRGNSDRNSVVVNVFYPAIIARYIMIHPKSWYGHISMRFEVYGCKKGFTIPTSQPCVNEFSMSESQMSASSEWNKDHGAANGMLHHQAGGGRTGAWSARNNYVNQWLQVDLRKIVKVTKIATQGRADANQWVKTYTIEYSLYGSDFVPYKVGNIEKVFAGNEDRYSEKINDFSNPIIARYIRIRPKSWNVHISMRFALYGCSFDKVSEEIAPCDSNPCGNNGECNNIKSSFSCACSRNFTGQTCQIFIGSGIVGILLRGDQNKLQQWNPLRFKESLAEKLNKYCRGCDEKVIRTIRDTENKKNLEFTANDIIIVGKPFTRPSEGFLFVEFAVMKTINGKTHLINPVKVRQAIMKGSRDGIAGYDVITHKKSVLYLQNKTPSKSKSSDWFKIGFVVVIVLMITIVIGVAIYITQRIRKRPQSHAAFPLKMYNMKSNQEKETASSEEYTPFT